ncbi:MAG: hypothetical protein AB1782_03525 [Cyanobacteriota bacterium]
MEIYVTMTSRRVPEPQEPDEVVKKLKDLARSPIKVVGLTVKSMLNLEKLLLEYKPKGQKAWDYQLVSIMLDN